jgi:ElaA protein
MTNYLTRMPKITTGWRRFDDLSPLTLYEVLRFRQDIFVVEQSSPYPDLDSLDQEAWHLLLHSDSVLAGYLRLRPMPGPPPLVSIGRVAVALHLRRRGLGRRLIQDALRLQHRRYPTHEPVLAAQADLVRFYQSFGFAAVSEPYDEYGVMHVEMRMRRDP